FGMTKSTAEAPCSGTGLRAPGACGLSADTAPTTLRLCDLSLIQGAAAGRVSKGGNAHLVCCPSFETAASRPPQDEAFACNDSNSTGKPLANRRLCRLPFNHADIRQSAEAMGPVQAVADQELIACMEAHEVGLELGAPLAGLVEQGAHRHVARTALEQQVLG